MDDVAAIVRGLNKARRAEMLRVRDGDLGYLARGDQEGLTAIGLALAPTNSMGFYRLTPLGLRVRAYLMEQTNGPE